MVAAPSAKNAMATERISNAHEAGGTYIYYKILQRVTNC